jgi:hypothetical protein
MYQPATNYSIIDPPQHEQELVRRYWEFFAPNHPKFNLTEQGKISQQFPNLMPYFKAYVQSRAGKRKAELLELRPNVVKKLAEIDAELKGLG